MAVVFLLVAVLQVLAGYLCAKAAQYITGKAWSGVLVLFLTIFPAGSLYLKNALPNHEWFTNFFCYVGYVYLGFVLYFSVYCVLVYLFHRFCRKIQLKKVLSTGSVFVSILLLGGYLNAINPRLKTINIEVNSTDTESDAEPNTRWNLESNAESVPDLKICFVSDIHIGCINTNRILNKVADHIKKSNPDVVIFGGDTLDIGSFRTYGQTFVDIMRDITSKYDTYAVIGNHELYAGVNECIKWMQKAGIKVLVDKVVQVKGFNIAGRLDQAVRPRTPLKGFSIAGRPDQSLRSREPLSKIVSGGLNNLIVVDHTPSDIAESVRHNALLHLSGHTHAGQIFPMNLVVNYMFGPTGDLRKLGNTYSYITSGAGFWGPPYRIGNVPEVVLINIFQKR